MSVNSARVEIDVPLLQRNALEDRLQLIEKRRLVRRLECAIAIERRSERQVTHPGVIYVVPQRHNVEGLRSVSRIGGGHPSADLNRLHAIVIEHQNRGYRSIRGIIKPVVVVDVVRKGGLRRAPAAGASISTKYEQASLPVGSQFAQRIYRARRTIERGETVAGEGFWIVI